MTVHIFFEEFTDTNSLFTIAQLFWVLNCQKSWFVNNIHLSSFFSYLFPTSASVDLSHSSQTFCLYTNNNNCFCTVQYYGETRPADGMLRFLGIFSGHNNKYKGDIIQNFTEKGWQFFERRRAARCLAPSLLDQCTNKLNFDFICFCIITELKSKRVYTLRR